MPHLKPRVQPSGRIAFLPRAEKWTEEWGRSVPYLHLASTSGNVRSCWMKQQASIWGDLLTAGSVPENSALLPWGLMTRQESLRMRKPWAWTMHTKARLRSTSKVIPSSPHRRLLGIKVGVGWKDKDDQGKETIIRGLSLNDSNFPPSQISTLLQLIALSNPSPICG